MKSLKGIFAAFCFLAFSLSMSAQKVVGYMDVNLSEAADRADLMNWSHMTDFIYGFITPDASGNLPNPTGLKLFNVLRQKCIDNGVNLHFSSGGASNSGVFSNLGQNPTATANYAKQIADILETYGMKGWDLDWEFPNGATALQSQVNILKAVHDEFTSRGKRDEWKIGIAVGCETPSVGPQGVYHTDYCSPDAFQYIDFLYMMSYDIGRTISGDDNHSSYEDAVNNIYDWNQKGCPISKMVLGVPFYLRHKTTRGLPAGNFYNITYGYQSESNPVLYYNQNNVGDYYYNGAPLLRQKIDYIMQQGGAGIMVWEVTYDRFDEYSLLKALHDKMEEYRCDAPTPDLGADVSICGLSSVTLDGGVAQQSGVTFTWKKGATTLVNQSLTANTYNATSSGTYTLEVWKDGCNRSDEIEITGVLNTPDLGGPYELCDPVSVTLDAGVSVAGRTIEWQLNNQSIYGENESTLNVTKGGTYKVIVSASGCSSVSTSSVVTSEVPYAVADTVCSEGDEAELIASEDVKWYDTDISATELITSSTFNPIVTSNTTYWMGGVGSSLTQYDFLQNMTAFWSRNAANYYSRKITVQSELTINSVKIDASNVGSLTLNLRPAGATTQPAIKTKTVNVSTGENVILLNWENIQPGDYYLDADGSTIAMTLRNLPDSDFEIAGIIYSEAAGYANNWNYASTQDGCFFYDMVLTAGKECARVPVNVVIDASNPGCLSVGTKQSKMPDVKVYPNPSNSEFSISNYYGVLNIYDIKGALVKTQNLTGGVSTFGKDLEKGVYFIQVNNDSGFQTMKVVKK